MRLSASRSCLVAGAKPRRVLSRAGTITSRFESLEKLWRRRDERTSFGPSRRDSNPCFSLERASPWVVISPTSTPGATARCHSRHGIVPRIHLLFVDLSWSTKSRAIPKSRFVRSAAAYPQRHAEGPVGQSWSRAELTTLGCCDGEPSRKPSADRRFAEAFRSQAKTLRPE